MTEWVSLTGGAGSLQIRVSYKANQVRALKWIMADFQNQALTIDAFDLLKVVGKGSFGKVATYLIHHTYSAGHASAQAGHITNIRAQDDSKGTYCVTI